jgi:hypothetical protein
MTKSRAESNTDCCGIPTALPSSRGKYAQMLKSAPRRHIGNRKGFPGDDECGYQSDVALIQ